MKVPETWDEFEQLVKDIVAKGQTPFGIAGAEAWTLNGYNQLAFATAAGGGKEANQYLRYSQPNAIKLSDPIMKDDIKVMDILALKVLAKELGRCRLYRRYRSLRAWGCPHDTKWILGYHRDQ